MVRARMFSSPNRVLTALLLLHAGGMLTAQPGPRFEIRVTVVDDLNQPVYGIDVLLQSYPSEIPGAPRPERYGEYQKTDVNGVLTFSPPRAGRFLVAPGRSDNYGMGGVVTELTPEAPAASVRMEIFRMAIVSGTLVDAETRQPVARALARLIPLTRSPGLGAAQSTPTDAEGRFRMSLPDVVPVTLRVEPSLWATSEHYLTEFTDDDLEKTDEDYEPVFPLGGVTEQTAPPLFLARGRTFDRGNIPVRKATYRRVVVRNRSAPCAEQETFSLRLYREDESRLDLFVERVPCGQDLLLLGMVPGSRYRLELSSHFSAADQTRRWAETDSVVGDRNLEVIIAPRRGVELRGRIVLAEGSAPWPRDLKVGLIEDGFSRLTSPVDTEGHFALPYALLGWRAMRLAGLGEAHVIQRVTFNGKPLPVLGFGQPEFDWRGDGELVITLDDKPGTLLGEVSDGSRAVAGAEVVIAAWPLPDARNIAQGRTFLDTDTQGRYLAPRLPAGEYRVFAIPKGLRPFADQPGVYERLAARGEKVTLGRGGAVTVNLRVSDPTR